MRIEICPNTRKVALRAIDQASKTGASLKVTVKKPNSSEGSEIITVEIKGVFDLSGDQRSLR